MNMNNVHMHGMVNFQVSILQYYIPVLSILHVDRSVNSTVHAWGIFVAMHEDIHTYNILVMAMSNLIPKAPPPGLDHVTS